MPNYTPDATATQAPAAAPEPDNAPVLDLPADLEALDAASVAQAFMALGDAVAWAKTPRAKGSAWAQKILRFKTALLAERFGIDHLGFPGGRYVGWQEWWRGADSQLGTGTNTFENTVAYWFATVTTTGGGIAVNNPTDARALLSRVALLSMGTNVAESSTLLAPASGRFTANSHIALDADVYPELGSTGQIDYVVGLGQKFGDDTALIGGVFEKKAADTNWFAVCGDGSSLSARVDTGVAVAAAAWNKMRVEWHGATVADNSTAAMRFYIADALVATITSTLPTGAATPSVFAILGAKRASGSTATSFYLGPVRFTQSY